MKRLGIVSQSAFDTGQLPVSCDIVPNGWGVSISQALWKQYKKRGFTMTSMCLALGSDGVNFDPETGKRLPLYEFNGSDAGLRPLWVSDCFKTIDITGRGGYLVSWRPTGCKMQFHPMTGLRVSNPAAVELSAGGEAGGGVDETNENNTASEEKLKKLIYGQ
jgi:hypothetical protein